MTDIAYLTPDGDIVVAGFVAWKRASFVDDDRAIPDSWRRLIVCPADAPVASVDDLAALVRRLVQALRKSAPDNEILETAMDYLQRKGLAGSPLRARAAMRELGRSVAAVTINCEEEI